LRPFGHLGGRRRRNAPLPFHFIREVIGNIYEPGFENALRETPCVNGACGCHIGYVHMDELKLYEVFGEGVLERIPAGRV